MKKIIYLLLIISFQLNAQTDPWTDYMTPASVHKQLAGYTGDFNMEIKMMDEGADSMKFQVKCKNTMRMGERFLHISQSGDMMSMPFEAVTMLGFNYASQKFELSSFSNMGTGTVFLSGKWIEKDKKADIFGEMINPADKSVIKVRQRLSFLNSDEILIENFDQSGTGKEKLSMSYHLKRNK